MKLNKATILILSSLVSAQTMAEDIEIYTGIKEDDSNINVMLMLDTSGSMDTRVSGTSETRMTQAKTALKSVINQLPDDINVGLGHFNHPGGSIIYPTTKLGNIKASSLIKKVSSDGYEEEGKTEDVKINTTNLLFEPKIKTIIDRLDNDSEDAVSCNDGGYYDYTNHYFYAPYYYYYCTSVNGLRFNDMNIPKNADIISAYLFLYSREANNDISTNIYMEDNIDASFFNRKNIVSRNYHNEKINWSLKSNSRYDFNISPNLKTLVEKSTSDGNWDRYDNSFTFKLDSMYSSYRNSYYTATASQNYRPELRVSYHDGSIKENLIALKFDDINISSNASINSAKIKLVSSSPNGSGTLKFQIENTSTPSDLQENDNDISDRSLRFQELEIPYTDWNMGEARFFDVKDLVKSAVSDSDWCGGKDFNFIVKSETATSVYSQDYSVNNSPELQVDYLSDENGCSLKTEVNQISQHDDDSQEDQKNNKNYPFKSKITIKKNNSLGGFIFRNTDLDSSSSIKKAYLQLITNSGNDTDKNYDIDINLVFPDNYPIPVFNSNKKHLKNRNTLTSSVNWRIDDAENNNVYNSNDISHLLNNIISTSKYQNATEKAFEIRLTNKSNKNFFLYSFDDNSSKSLKLIVEFEGKAGVEGMTVREDLINLIDQQYSQGYTPLKGSLYEAGQYFMSGKVDYGRTRKNNNARLSSDGSYSGGAPVRYGNCTEENQSSSDCYYSYISGSPVYDTPMTDQICESNNIILITDGEPSSTSANNYNGVPLKTLIEGQTGGDCNNEWECLNTWANYMNNTDFMTNKQGMSNINTHTVGFVELSTRTNLQQLANSGGGVFAPASNTEDLVKALNLIVSNILQIESTIASPGVTVNQNNRQQHLSDVYYSLFQPSLSKSWIGNLKKYNISSNKETIVDKFDKEAVDENTGFFKEGTTSYWSSAPDGGDVSKGGAAEQQTLSRNIYTYTGLDNANNEDLTLSKNKVSASNIHLTKSLFGLSSSFDNNEFNLLRNWLSGIDVFDENFNGSYSDAKKIMKDPLHSRPIVINYGNESVVFVSTNEGFLHALNTESGEEKFSFIPQELLPNAYSIFQNGSSNHIYGLDASWVSWYHDENKDGIIRKSDGDWVYLYSGMRRGGNNFYALDVTDITKPMLKYVLNESTAGFENIGQTWSEPVLGRIKINGEDKIVSIFGGGFDSSYDNASFKGGISNSGSDVYVIDAETGDLIVSLSGELSSGNVKINGMNFSITSKPNIQDVDGDGYIDYIYLTDLNSQIIKIKIDNKAENSINVFSGKVIAKLGNTSNDTSLTSSRMMFDSISITPMLKNGEKFMAIVGGTGYRAHPLNLTRQDIVFMIKDKEVFDSSQSIDKPLTLNDLDNNTDLRNALNNTVEKGYYFELKDNGMNVGEKITGESVVFNGSVYLSSYVPSDNQIDCAPVVGYTRSYEFDLLTGNPNKDQNGDGIVNEEDRYIGETSSGMANGSKVIYTEEGVFLLTGTKVKKISEANKSGVQRRRWYVIPNDSREFEEAKINSCELANKINPGNNYCKS